MSGPPERAIEIDVRVPAEHRGYPVIVGPGVLSGVGREIRRMTPQATAVMVVSDHNVAPLYGDTVAAALDEAGLRRVTHDVAPGEGSKTPTVLFGLLRAMAEASMSRRDVVVALGGGVVGDLAGLAAALYMRGIAFIPCPTSLLAQVDASVGGKVAVDLPLGSGPSAESDAGHAAAPSAKNGTAKNMIGAFHFPRVVLIDPTVLVTLDDRELGCGLAEMLKHGALFSHDHVEQLLRHADDFYARNGPIVGRLAARSVALKAACVSRDPFEDPAGRGRLAGTPMGRVLLNLGHTVGHAIEASSNFTLAHGEAVALGLRAAARVSAAKGLAPPELEGEVVAALTKLRLPTDLDAWLDAQRGRAVLHALGHDKKREAATLTYIALTGWGKPLTLPLRPQEIMGLLRGADRGG